MSSEPEETKDSTPEPASTVVLMRPMDGVPFEVFLVRRHRKSRFMANAYVYPGGRLDDTDCEVTLINHCRDYLPEVISDQMNVEGETARGLYVAAVRETFEEAGALLFVEADGTPIDLANPDELDRYELYREALVDEEVTFDQLIGWEDLIISFEKLVYFAHWITPEIEPLRYDTRFFLTRTPEGQELIHDNQETTDSIWITPAEALERYERSELHLAPPTIITLWQLTHFHSIDHVFDYYRDRPVARVLPYPVAQNGTMVLALPGDPDYPEVVHVSVEGPTRLVLESGLWRPVVTDETSFPGPPIEREVLALTSESGDDDDDDDPSQFEV